MHREQARLGGKAEQDAQRGGPQPAALHGGHGVVQLRDHQRAGGVIQQEQAHQRHQTAQHRDGQVGLTGVHGVGGLLLHHPHIGAEGHRLEEQEGGIQVGGQEHARREAQADQEEEIVPLQMVVTVEILGTQQGRDEPHEAHHDAVQLLEPAGPEAQAHHRHGDGGAVSGGHIHHGQQRQQREHDGQRTQPLSVVMAIRQQSDDQRRQHRQQHNGQQHDRCHHSITAFPITSSRTSGNRPISRHSAARISIGTIMKGPASWALSGVGSSVPSAGNQALTTTWNM